MKTCIIIPAHNEESKIADVIYAVKKYCTDIIVVDNASNDNTSSRAEEAGALVLCCEAKGKGNALKAGFLYACKNAYDAVITLDGDGQHAAEDLPALIHAGTYNTFVIGARHSANSRMPFLIRLSNRVISLIISSFCRQRIRDTQSGLRFIRTSLITKITCHTSRYQMETEFIIKAARIGIQIKEIPIKTIYHTRRLRPSVFIDTLDMFLLLSKMLFS